MAYIKVCISDIKRSAEATENFVNQTVQRMRDANTEVNTNLAKSWSGPDYDNYKVQFGTLSEKGSTANKMLSELTSYSEYLKFAATRYIMAQQSAEMLASLIRF